MKNIINVNVDDKEIHIKIEGDNVDILQAIGEILITMERESGLEIETSMKYISEVVEQSNEK